MASVRSKGRRPGGTESCDDGKDIMSMLSPLPTMKPWQRPVDAWASGSGVERFSVGGFDMADEKRLRWKCGPFSRHGLCL